MLFVTIQICNYFFVYRSSGSPAVWTSLSLIRSKMSKEVELKEVKENEQEEKETDLDGDESTPMVAYGELVSLSFLRHFKNFLKSFIRLKSSF